MVSVFDAVVSPQVSAGLMFRLMVLIMMKPRSKTAGLLCSSGPESFTSSCIRHERRKPAWQTPTHRSGAGLHTENEDGELIKPANQPLTNIQLSDLYLQCSGDCWTFNDKIIIQPLKGHSVFIKLKSVPHMTGIMCPLWGQLFKIISYGVVLTNRSYLSAASMIRY